MCIEFAFKKAGIPIIRNFLHSTEGVVYGLPSRVQKNLSVNYTVKSYLGGKVHTARVVQTYIDGFHCKGDTK